MQGFEGSGEQTYKEQNDFQTISSGKERAEWSNQEIIEKFKIKDKEEDRKRITTFPGTIDFQSLKQN